jgi:hypothetical protein
MIDKEFNEFLKSEEKATPNKLSQKVMNAARTHLSPAPEKVLAKYLGLFVGSIFLSLTLCPQSGVSFLRDDFPLFHHFFHQNMILCAAYCASVFFFTTHVLSFLILNRYEKLTFSRKLQFVPIATLSAAFGVLMFLSPANSRDHFWDLSYVSAWLLVMASLFYLWKKTGEKLLQAQSGFNF